MFTIIFGAGAEEKFLLKYANATLPINEKRIDSYDFWLNYSGLIGIVITAIVVRIYGRRSALIFVYAIFLSGLYILLMSPSLRMSSMGYISWVFATETLPMAEIMYITEIAEPDLRGFFCASTILFHQLGTSIGNSIPSYKEPNQATVATWCMWPTLCILMSMAVPESPQWLVNNRRRFTAKKQFTWLYKEKKKNTRIFKDLIKSSNEFKKTSAISKIFTKSFLRPMMILLMIYASKNSLEIFERIYGLVGDTVFTEDVPAHYRKMNGIVDKIGPIMVLLMIYRLTRKWLFILPTALAYIFALGIKLFGEETKTSVYLWCVFAYKAFTSVGMKTLPASFAAEYFSPNLREFGCAVVLLQANYFDKLIKWKSSNLSNRHDLFWIWWCIGIACITAMFYTMPVPDGVTLTTLAKRINGKWKQIYSEKDVIEDESVEDKDAEEEQIQEEELPRSPVEIEVLD